MSKEYDLVILGGGTGGYVGAIRAAQLGLKTAIVEQDKLGGTCLHKGCIPSKALLRSAEVYRLANQSAQFGVVNNGVSLDYQKVLSRKNDIVNKLYQGVQYLIKKGKIDLYNGTGRILGPSIFSPLPGAISVEYKNATENDILQPKNVIIATGSKPRELKDLPFDEHILSSDSAFELQELPKSIVIIGGGVIGIEWASMLLDFGVKVIVLEAGNQIIPHADVDIANELKKSLIQKGMEIYTNVDIQTDSYVKKDDSIQIEAIISDERKQFTAEKMLISIGRDGNINNIGIQNTGITTNRSFIEVNTNYQTTDTHIYAIGDCIGGMQLAHVAAHEAIRAVEHIHGEQLEEFDSKRVPSCVYSHPEIASIGLTEKEALDERYEVKTGTFPFQANGKALIYGEANGFAKIIVDQKTNDVLGVHIIGPHATEMISEASLAAFVDASAWELGAMIHPHPSLSEVIGEAALAVDGVAIHI